jgi:hypothetical protein
MKKPNVSEAKYARTRTRFSAWFRLPTAALFLVLLLQPVSPALANETTETTAQPSASQPSTSNEAGESEDVTSDDSASVSEQDLAITDEVQSGEVDLEVSDDNSSESASDEVAPLPLEPDPAAPPIDTTPSDPDTPLVILEPLPGTPLDPLPGDGTDPLPLPPDGISDDLSTTTLPVEIEEEIDPVEEIPSLVIDPIAVDDLPTPPLDEVENEDDESASTTATTTPDTLVTVEQPFVATVQNDSNKYSFKDGECTLMRDDTYYCAKTVSTSTALAIVPDGVSALPDSDGDKEIYVSRGTDMVQLTKNFFEDDAPYFDAVSNEVVWHRLIQGRYQIMSYSLDTEEEVQLTDDRFNNMEPSRYDTAIVWQGWVGNDWEIMMLEGDELRMLTDNTYPDIGPRINKEYVLWQSFENDSWKLKVLNRTDGTIETIDGGDGASIDNPRFVLVYDAKSESGDIETRGYDLEEKTIVPLSATPKELPDELPDPEQTGEERALIQQLVQKPKTESEVDTDIDSDLDIENPDENDESELVQADVIVPPFELSTSTEDLSSELEEDIATVVVTPYEPPEVEPVVPDLVVPLYNDEAEEDPQSAVASNP